MTSESGFDLKGIRAGLITVLEDISGISVERDPGSRAVGEEEATWVMPDPETQATLKLQLLSVLTNGNPEQRYDGDGDLEENTGSNRILTFGIKVECHRSRELAFEYTEKVRSNLERPSVLDTLATFGVSFNDIKGSFSTNYTREGRLVSVAGFDLVLNTVSNLSDTVGEIKTATATREV